MVTFREWINALRELGLSPQRPLIVHAALSTVGEIRGGAETVLGALLAASKGVMAPTFTYKTMLVPEVGPPHNAMTYGTAKDQNRMAECYTPDMPADRLMGILPETIRTYPGAMRSIHPVLSFAAIGLADAIEAQTIDDHLAPIARLADQDALVLLIGVDHTANTSIHYAEKLAGRREFLRWGLTQEGVVACPSFSGCSDGFEAAAPLLKDITRFAQVGNATLRALPLAAMTHLLVDLMQSEPTALLCHKHGCERCEAHRQDVQSAQSTLA